MRPPPKNRRYIWSAEMDAQLTSAYRTAAGKRELSGAMTKLAARHRLPRYIIQNRAQDLGLRIREQRNWIPEELDELCELSGSLSVAAVAARLHRSPSAVKNKLFQLRVSRQVTEGFSANELAKLFGVHHAKVGIWIKRGWLRLVEDRIAHGSVERFVWEHMDEYRFAAAEEWWLKQMLRSGRLAIRRGRERLPDKAARKVA